VTHRITEHLREVPPEEIDKTLNLKGKYENDPTSHTHDREPFMSDIVEISPDEACSDNPGERGAYW
jgi:hypothetical protein